MSVHNVKAAAVSSATHSESLWAHVFSTPAFWVSAVFLLVASVLHAISWASEDYSNIDPDNKAGDGLRSAVTAGLTVVSILLPASIFVTRLGTAGTPLPALASTELFITSMWLLVSLVFGLYVIFVAVTRAFDASPFRRKDIGFCFGWQILFLFGGVLTFVWSMATIASNLIR